jgi:hypothetical protein
MIDAPVAHEPRQDSRTSGVSMSKNSNRVIERGRLERRLVHEFGVTAMVGTSGQVAAGPGAAAQDTDRDWSLFGSDLTLVLAQLVTQIATRQTQTARSLCLFAACIL